MGVGSVRVTLRCRPHLTTHQLSSPTHTLLEQRWQLVQGVEGPCLGADLMQAGGDVLGRCLTAKHVALEHLGQFISSYVGKVPVGGGSPQYP